MANKYLKLSGEIPDVRLYRFFSVRSYAEQFANGKVRFGWQKKYSSMEGDVREDTTEGTASFTVKGKKLGEVYESGSIGGWESYILCTSQVDCASKLRTLSERFSHADDKAGYFVELQDLHRFTEDVAKALQKSPYWDAIDYIFWKEVKYNKFKNFGNEPPDVEFHSYQKPATISTITYKNKKSGKKVTLSSLHMFLAGQGDLAKRYWPETEWTKTETKHDYTVEKEWRLIVSIKPSFKVEQANIPMFVTGAERKKRICSHLKIDVKQLNNYSTAEINRLVPASSYWLDTIEVNSKIGVGNYLRVDEIKFNRLSYLHLAIRHIRMKMHWLAGERT